MKLIQINVFDRPTAKQKEKLKNIIPYHKIKDNGNYSIKKLNKHFNDKKEIDNYKRELSRMTGVKITNILFTFQHSEDLI